MSTLVIAKIDENTCIGCTKCIDVCPVDAIIGASKQMHTVLEDYCIGCQLCLPPCPMDCIELIPVVLTQTQQLEKASLGRQRVRIRKERLNAKKVLKEMADKEKTTDIQALIAASIARSQEKRLNLREDKS